MAWPGVTVSLLGTALEFAVSLLLMYYGGFGVNIILLKKIRV